MGHQKFILTMLQTNLCGTTFPLSKQSLLYKLISTLKESHFCGENFMEKGTTRWQFSPPFLQRGVAKRGVTALKIIMPYIFHQIFSLNNPLPTCILLTFYLTII